MNTNVNINDRQAKETLDMIRQTKKRTQKSISSSETSPWLILWGSLWVAGYMTCHFYVQHANLIFTVMCILGGLGSWAIAWWQKTKGPVKTDAKNPLGRKIFWFWFVLFSYVSVWLALLSPFNGLQMNATMVTAVMFAYIVMGLLYETPSLILIGIFVTAATLVGYFALPAYYCLCLAACGGGTLLATGLYMRVDVD
jgi:hypothetical protein